jgi:hypothetical protein
MNEYERRYRKGSKEANLQWAFDKVILASFSSNFCPGAVDVTLFSSCCDNAVRLATSMMRIWDRKMANTGRHGSMSTQSTAHTRELSTYLVYDRMTVIQRASIQPDLVYHRGIIFDLTRIFSFSVVPYCLWMNVPVHAGILIFSLVS